MKGREGKGPPPSTDLLVCFPSRAHLTLMHKPICSPARPLSSDSTKRRHHNHHQHLKKSTSSPLLWAKMTTATKPISKDTLISEPTSPKVTCAGQIKVRSKPSTTTATGSSCKNWQSVMEEIERLHNNNNNNNKKKKKSKSAAAWVESHSLGFKKDAMQFLTCLRNIRFDFRCFGSFPTSAGITSDDDDDDDEEDDESEEEEEKNNRESRISSDVDGEGETSRTVFSKWFMVLQEENSKNGESNNNNNSTEEKEEEEEEDVVPPPPPPPNALLLMRCRSAPAKSWLQQRQQLALEKQKQKEEEEEDEKQEMEKENLVVMRYGAGIDDDLYKISTDIAKETWIVGGISRDPLIKRSRSWKI